jgi:hypothetical protein
MLRIVDASSLVGVQAKQAERLRVPLPEEAYLELEGEGELLVQLIRDERVDLSDLQNGTLYVYAITDRNRSSLGYFGQVCYLEIPVP